MKYSQIHKRYAKALYELAEELEIISEVNKDMLSLQLVVTKSSEFKSILKSPVIKPHLKNKIIIGLFEKKFQKLSLQFLSLLIRKGRELYVGEIAEQFIIINKEKQGIIDVNISSVNSLDSNLISLLSSKVAKYTGKEPEITESIKAHLLGGFTIRFGDAMLDASIRNKLNRISHKFKNNIYKKGF